MNEIVVLNAKRTPIGKFLGQFNSLTAFQLGSDIIKAVVEKEDMRKFNVDEVVIGNAIQAGVGQNPARIAALNGGLPNKTKCMTVNKVCGSGMQAIISAVQSIKSGDAEIVVAGGMESMSNAPHLFRQGREIKKYGNIKKREIGEYEKDFELTDSMIYDSLWCAFNSCHMGSLAEELRKKNKISREEQDSFSLKSHKKAISAMEKDKFHKEIVPVKVGNKKISTDEGPRKDTSIEKLSALKTVFYQDGTITAGNSSQLSDGAAALALTSKEKAEKLGVAPLAVIESYASSSADPKWYTLAPVDAVRELLKKTGNKIDDFDIIELNEAYALQSLAVMKELGMDEEKVNVNGGAIALGHPIGCTGARILVTLIHALKNRRKDFGLATMCIGGGEAMAMSVRLW